MYFDGIKILIYRYFVIVYHFLSKKTIKKLDNGKNAEVLCHCINYPKKCIKITPPRNTVDKIDYKKQDQFLIADLRRKEKRLLSKIKDNF